MSGKFWLVYATASTIASGSLFLSLSQKLQLGSPLIMRRHLSCSPFSRSAVSRSMPKGPESGELSLPVGVEQGRLGALGAGQDGGDQVGLGELVDGGHGFGVERVGAGVIQGSGEGRFGRSPAWRGR